MRRTIMQLIFYCFTAVSFDLLAEVPEDMKHDAEQLGYGVCEVHGSQGRVYYNCAVYKLKGDEEYHYVVLENQDHKPLYILQKNIKTGETKLVWSFRWIST